MICWFSSTIRSRNGPTRRNQDESARGADEFIPEWGPKDQDQLAAKVAAVFGIVAETKGARRGDD